MSVNNGAEPEVDDAPALAEWYAKAVQRWRVLAPAASHATDEARKAEREVERARSRLERAMRGGADLPPIPPQEARTR